MRWDKVDLFHWVLDVQCGHIVLQIKAKELKKPWGGGREGRRVPQSDRLVTVKVGDKERAYLSSRALTFSALLVFIFATALSSSIHPNFSQ